MILVEPLALKLREDLPISQLRNFRRPAQVFKLFFDRNQLVDPFGVVRVIRRNM